MEIATVEYIVIGHIHDRVVIGRVQLIRYGLFGMHQRIEYGAQYLRYAAE